LGKTKLCKFWSRGHCSRGRACTFAHGRKELREQPNLFRTELCFEFMSTGTCYHGAACKYAHNEREIRASMVTPQVHVQQQRLPKDSEDDLSTQPADRDLISRLAAMEEEAERLRAQIRAMVQAASASVSKPTCLSTASESWSIQTTAQMDSDSSLCNSGDVTDNEFDSIVGSAASEGGEVEVDVNLVVKNSFFAMLPVVSESHRRTQSVPAKIIAC